MHFVIPPPLNRKAASSKNFMLQLLQPFIVPFLTFLIFVVVVGQYGFTFEIHFDSLNFTTLLNCVKNTIELRSQTQLNCVQT